MDTNTGATNGTQNGRETTASSGHSRAPAVGIEFDARRAQNYASYQANRGTIFCFLKD